ncbi:DDE superfamily endonuclease, CENP-B-like protein [Purpureocillium lavendulum]|uniref:DDE superfamily endonuclease, CENP-B-like protein n=1 Tax=Purpureocillium lavendulum TaxID=1247861 RepID=A0AB34FAZ1_9HYPO|nr:DDE superfamily endonuclease, CENP-B-like protein [Purpureocillium lavendulum]
MIGQQNAIDRLFEQQAARQEGHDIEQEHHLLAAVDDELYNQALVNLLTAHSLPHSLVEWPEWYAMLHTVNYMAPGVVTQSRGQVPKLLEASFITHREKLRSKLKSSLTQVHFSIDIWSSPNHHSLLGIVAHFIDRECRQLRKALLALRELEGAHSGEAIAETFLTVIDSYGLHGQVGYFTLDNAYNNDTMLQAIAKACDFDTAHRRLRCNGHIINLAVQAFLFGRNKDASDEALRQVSQLSKDEQEGVADRRDTATAWRRHGALGMLHNLVVWVRSSGQRYQAFSKAAGRMIPQDNSTRWNSWYLMIHVAIKARKEVNSFIDDHYTEGDISLDYLHPEHWQELQEIHDFLQPFHEITKDTQWDNSSLDEVICSMDFLITHYKASTEKFRHSLTMTDRIMTSWYKFDDYYRRTDDSPVYAAAILLHPSLRRAHLHEAWKDQSQYIGPAVEAVRKLWEDYKPRQVPTINEDLSAYEAYKQRIYQPPSSHDEFNRFIDGPTLPIGSSSALSWWLEPTQATSFPNLYRLAVNIFSIPAMSAEAERVFSGARRTITWDRTADEDFSEQSADDNDEYCEVETVAEESQGQFPIPKVINAEELDKYRKFGPFGKLHNIGVAFRMSSQLVEDFHEAQRQATPAEPVLSWVQNGCTRWQSDEAMASRALLKRSALNRMISIIEERWIHQGGKEQDKPTILTERLSIEEWKVVSALQKILQPFKVASKQLQGEGIPGKRSTSGGFDEYFQVVEMLLDHLELAVQGVIIEEDDDKVMREVRLFDGMDAKTRRLLKIYIKLGWKKLNDYYGKLTSTAYVAAVVFHPCKKWRTLEQLWNQLPSRQTSEWKRAYERSLTKAWEERYKNMGLEDAGHGCLAGGSQGSLDYIERRLAFSRSMAGSAPQGRPNQRPKQPAVLPAQDELDQYLSEPPVDNMAYKADPIAWWRDVGVVRFPRLSHMAVDFLTIPSSSAETERDFSKPALSVDVGTRTEQGLN